MKVSALSSCAFTKHEIIFSNVLSDACSRLECAFESNLNDSIATAKSVLNPSICLLAVGFLLTMYSVASRSYDLSECKCHFFHACNEIYVDAAVFVLIGLKNTLFYIYYKLVKWVHQSLQYFYLPFWNHRTCQVEPFTCDEKLNSQTLFFFSHFYWCFHTDLIREKKAL